MIQNNNTIQNLQPGWPDFFIVGAAKAGTTSLFHYLSQHPQIFIPQNKEPNYFAHSNPRKEWEHLYKEKKDTKTYLSLFSKATEKQMKGEGSTAYLWDKTAPVLIKKKIPHSKIIILLREPIERAYSNYLMDVRDGIQSLPFYEALIKDAASSEKEVYGRSRLYIEMGCYAAQVKRYLDIFGCENVLILFFDNLKSHPEQVVKDSLIFLGISSLGVNLDFKVHNSFAVPRNKIASRFLKSPSVYTIARMLLPNALTSWTRKYILLKKSSKPVLPQQAFVYLQKIYERDTVMLNTVLKQYDSSLRLPSWLASSNHNL